MNSTIEYIRKLNQASVKVQTEWLTRLQNVDAGVETRVAIPEIVLTKETPAPKFASDETGLPVTMVNSSSQERGEKNKAIPGTHETIVTTAIEGLASLQADSQDETYFRSVTETASPKVWEFVGADGQTDNASTTHSVSTTSHAVHPQVNSTIKVPELDPAIDEVPVKSPVVQRLDAELDTPAVLADIVRPTIMPPSQNKVVDETLPREPLSESCMIGSQVTPAEKERCDDSKVCEDVPLDISKDLEVETGEQEEFVQLLSDFGLSGDSSSETLTREEMTELFPNLQTYEPSASHDQKESGHGEMMLCAFPDDKRGEHFTYEQTKRQALVDAIVDQIFERFQPGHHATIMLMAANREIDIDSAASRIATCLAGRETGETILVDANLASRQLTALLGVTNQPGITDAFEKASEIQTTLCATDRNDLKFIPAGTSDISDDYADLAATNEVNQSLKSRFDYTVVSGGIAGDPLTDAWSRVADGIYLIVDMDESDRAATVATVDYFRKLGARIVGCIATRA